MGLIKLNTQHWFYKSQGRKETFIFGAVNKKRDNTNMFLHFFLPTHAPGSNILLRKRRAAQGCGNSQSSRTLFLGPPSHPSFNQGASKEWKTYLDLSASLEQKGYTKQGSTASWPEALSLWGDFPHWYLSEAWSLPIGLPLLDCYVKKSDYFFIV